MDLFIEQGRRSAPPSACMDTDGAFRSVSHEAYRAELEYDRKRARLRKLRAVLRMLALIVFVPALLIAVFAASYAMTFILSGAEPAEVLEELADCFKMGLENIKSAFVLWGVGPFE